MGMGMMTSRTTSGMSRDMMRRAADAVSAMSEGQAERIAAREPDDIILSTSRELAPADADALRRTVWHLCCARTGN